MNLETASPLIPPTVPPAHPGNLPADKSWHVVWVCSGYESKFKAILERRIELSGKQELFGEVLIPQEHVWAGSKGSRKISPKRLYPGYVYVQMNLTEEARNLILSIPKFLDILPGTVSEKEIETIRGRAKTSRVKPRSEISFSEGEAVRIKDGPFDNFSGVVEEFKPDRGKLKVRLNVLGRSASVELGAEQAERA